MIKLTKSLGAWGTPAFNDVLKNEIENLDAQCLPLQQGLSHSSYAIDSEFNVMIINAWEENDFLHAKAGIFFYGVIAGCSCADDPTPVPEQSEYCEILVDIKKISAETCISLPEE
jgi:hypothetical protein